MKPSQIIEHVKSLKTKRIFDYEDARDMIEREVARGKIPREMRHAMTQVLYQKATGGRS